MRAISTLEMEWADKMSLTELGGGHIRFDCPMREHTTFRVGGPARALFEAQDEVHLCRMICHLRSKAIPYRIIGRGSNLLVPDEGYEGVLIHLGGELAGVDWEKDVPPRLCVGGGMGIGKLLERCRAKGYTGLEFLAGIPGTVGGAVCMNAGAFGREIESRVERVRVIGPQGDVQERARLGLQFSYRSLAMDAGTVITKVAFGLETGSPEQIARRLSAYGERRRAHQPMGYPSAGSVFKNPPGDFAGRLIDQAGLKGARIGGAQISEVHANFIINRGDARAADILSLINLVQERVREKWGVELEPEIRVIP